MNGIKHYTDLAVNPHSQHSFKVGNCTYSAAQYISSIAAKIPQPLPTLSKRDHAMFMHIAFLSERATNRVCYSKIVNLGKNLDKYGYKSINKTQAYESFSNLKKSGLIIFERPNRRSPYRTKLSMLGLDMYRRTVDNPLVTLGPTPKTGTRTGDTPDQKPVLLDPDLKKDKIRLFKQRKTVDKVEEEDGFCKSELTISLKNQAMRDIRAALNVPQRE